MPNVNAEDRYAAWLEAYRAACVGLATQYGYIPRAKVVALDMLTDGNGNDKPDMKLGIVGVPATDWQAPLPAEEQGEDDIHAADEADEA